jgi:tetratricopeptide (TPR) repeat protein
MRASPLALGLAVLATHAFAATALERGNALRLQGEWERAITEYSEAIRLDPHNADGYFRRGLS